MKLIASSIILVLVFLNLGISLAQHGQYRLERHNFWLTLFSTIIQLVLYYYAGLFDCFKD